MALSSKLVGKQVLNYLVSDVYAERVANLLDDPDLDVEQTVGFFCFRPFPCSYL